MVSLPYEPSATRTRGMVRIGRQQKSLALLLEVQTGTLYDEYRIEIVRTRTGETVLATDELAWSGSHLGVVISTAGFQDGRYDIRLFGIEDGAALPLKEVYEMSLIRW